MGKVAAKKVPQRRKRVVLVYDGAVFKRADIRCLARTMFGADTHIYALRGNHLKFDLQFWDIDDLKNPDMHVIRDILKEQTTL